MGAKEEERRYHSYQPYWQIDRVDFGELGRGNLILETFNQNYSMRANILYLTKQNLSEELRIHLSGTRYCSLHFF